MCRQKRCNSVTIPLQCFNPIRGSIDPTQRKQLTAICSDKENTCGKSSILAAIYYCLGLEQILGGVAGIGGKVLTSAFKNVIDDNGTSWNVTESGAYLEISNGTETITIYRNIKAENKDNRLITVYFGKYDAIENPQIESEDFYVNIQHSATSRRGFHSFLEEFLHLNLPLVHTSDGSERKLYLQIIFSAMFIEQKHGWSDILSGMPIFGIRESKKRVVEYILGLDTLKNEKEKELLNTEKTAIENEWKHLVQDIQKKVYAESCDVVHIPHFPCVLSETDLERMGVLASEGITIGERNRQLETQYNSLRQLKPRVTDNFESLNKELSETESAILSFEEIVRQLIYKLSVIDEAIHRLTSDIQLVCDDIRNNEDAARLQKFGSESSDGQISTSICPTCKQQIQDNLLEATPCSGFMNIEENIRHLKAQKSMLEFSLNSRKNYRDALQREKTNYESRLLTLRRLAQTIRSDLFTSTDTDASETIILKKIEISKQIERLANLQDAFISFRDALTHLSDRWSSYLDRKKRLPKKGLSESDSCKIKLLKSYFIKNLQRYHYSSLVSLDGIEISEESLLPTIDGFDMKFDSSASDGIRTIWAFTLALLQVSIEKGGNHPGIIIFDEPAQQSIVSEDMNSFILSATEIGSKSQIIMAITLNSHELIQIIDGLDAQKYHKLEILDKAFKRLAESVSVEESE